MLGAYQRSVYDGVMVIDAQCLVTFWQKNVKSDERLMKNRKKKSL